MTPDVMDSPSFECIKKVQRYVTDQMESKGEPLPPHIIHLKGDIGEIKPHVDNVKFSGGFIAGLSLQSCRRMILKPAPQQCDLVKIPVYRDIAEIVIELRVRSLYILSGPLRFNFTHQIDVGEEERMSVLFRDVNK